MGIVGVEKYLESYGDTCRLIDIRKAVDEDDRKVIVVDGNVFHHMYVFRRFQWICGGILEFVGVVQDFVRAFEELGIKLVFFFCDHDSKEVRRQKWVRDRCANVRYAKKVLRKVEQMEISVAHLGSLREGEPHTPVDIKCWVREALQEIQCEVICPATDHVYHIASYARQNNCLAIISQTTYFIFYEDLTSDIWSMKHFDLKNMQTKAYYRESLAWRLHLNKKFFPLFATLLGTTSMVKDWNRKKVRNCIRKQVSCALASDNMCDVAAQYIRENFDYNHMENVPAVLTQHFPAFSSMLVSDYYMYEKKFKFQQDEENEMANRSEMNMRENIIKVCRQLQKTGKMCNKLRVLLEKQLYEQHTMLEDFIDLPPLGLMYRTLRQKLYAILFHESVGYVEQCQVEEWCIEEGGCLRSTNVSPAYLDKSFHPGLLTLWDFSNTDGGIAEKKWQLFAHAVSSTLNYSLLRNLPSRLVIPAALLHYLYNEIPLIFPEYSCNLLRPWEIQVFIAVAVTLPTKNADFARRMVIHRGNMRAIRLTALFMHGCHTMEMLHQACGFVVRKPNSVWYYFDGKLFHYLYEKAQRGYNIMDYHCSPELLAQFEIVRKIVFLDR